MQDRIGTSVLGIASGSPQITSLAEQMAKGISGDAFYLDLSGQSGSSGSLVKKRAVYIPINIADSFWTIVVDSDEAEILDTLIKFRNRIIFLIFIMLSGAALFFYYGLRAWIIVQEGAEKRAAVKAMEESEEKYRTLFESSADSLMVIDAETRLITDCNLAAVSLFQYTNADELIGKPPQDLSPEFQPCGQESSKLADQYIVQALEEGSAVFEWTLIRAGGETFLATVSLSALNSAKGRSVFVSARDISKQRELEQLAIRSEKLEATSILVGGISHDFNNLLTSIMGYINLVMMDLKEDDENAEYLEKALSSCRETSELTEQLLSFSRGLSPSKTLSSIGDILDKTTEAVLSDEEYSAELQLDDNLWQVEVDRVQMSQVFKNILANAKESMSGGGHISILGTNVESLDEEAIPESASPSGHYVKIVITDQGHGISESIRQSIFDPYFSTKSLGNQKGMGLGLTIALSVVKQHDGFLTVNSQKSGSTQFNIYLPAADTKGQTTGNSA